MKILISHDQVLLVLWLCIL